MQAHRASQHPWQGSLAYPVRQSWEEDPTDRSYRLHWGAQFTQDGSQVVRQQSHASLTSAVNRALLWLLAKYFHNVCLYKL